jgi:signal transduction histidine kinase/ActR/RegA family two-component response regulator
MRWQPWAEARLGAADAHADEAFDRERLSVLVGYSAALRVQMTTIAIVIGAISHAGGAPLAQVLVWLAGTILVRETRASFLLRLNRDSAPIDERLRKTIGWTLALGAAYGASSIFMIHTDRAFDAILTMILMSLSAGAVSTTFTLVPALVAFAAGIALPLFVLWALGGVDWLDWAVAGLVVLFFGVQVRFAGQNMRMFADSYRMRLENAKLLSDLTAERARLATARDTAVAADLSKSRFLAAASHDLRQPLQSLALNSGALSRMEMSEPSREIANDIGVGIDALRRMLDALLDISQLEAGAVAPDLRPISVERLLESLCLRQRPAAQIKGLSLNWHSEPGTTVFSDAQMLQRVLANLLDNALKFTERGSIELSARRVGDRIELTVRDTGRGIDEADQALVFEDLTQLHNPRRDRALGHGLGLGIVRRLCRLLGIEVGVESRVGEGTCFTLRVPISADASASPSESAPSHPGLVARRVLVLDDDQAVRSAYRAALNSMGCAVSVASDLRQAEAALDTEGIEVALVDFRLANDMNGLEAVARLRKRCPGLAALIVSADTSAALRELAAQEGVPMLRKPVSDALLAIAINNALADAAAARRPVRGV